MSNKEIQELKELAKRVRMDIIEMTYRAQSGHQGGALSWVEIGLVLFFKVMNIKRENPFWEDRDRFILSKGHGCATLYSIWSLLGWIKREDLYLFRNVKGVLQGHPSRRRTPLAEASTGSLSQGVSISVGMALGLKLSKKTSRVWTIISDAELQEGQTWEAFMFAGNRDLNNLTFILDYNHLQIEGNVNEINDPEPIKDKAESFKLAVMEVDGHDIKALYDAFQWAKRQSKPQLIIAHTVKGKGISFMENDYKWHSSKITPEIYEKALKELAK